MLIYNQYGGYKFKNARNKKGDKFMYGELPASPILQSLFLSGINSATDKKMLKELGITHIVDIQNYTFSKIDNIKYLRVPIYDSPDEDIIDKINEVNTFIDNAIKSKGKVLVHCQMGISRSSSFIISYLMKTYNCSFDKVYDFVKNKRSTVYPNIGFVLQLQKYQDILNINDDSKCLL